MTPERLEQIRRVLRIDNQGSYLLAAIAELINEVDRCWQALKAAEEEESE